MSPKGSRRARERVGRDQRLADALWRSGNHDARVLAAQIADGSLIDRSTADHWIAGADHLTLPQADTVPSVVLAADVLMLIGSWLPVLLAIGFIAILVLRRRDRRRNDTDE